MNTYQNDINEHLNCVSDISESSLLGLFELFKVINHPIVDEESLLESLNLLEFLSGLKQDDNACLAFSLDQLIEKIETYEQAQTPNQRLVALMKQHGTKQKDLSHIVPQSIISELVNDKRQLNLRHIKALASYYKVSPSYFMLDPS